MNNNDDLAGHLLQQVMESDEVQAIQPLKIGQGSSKNELVLFVKPEVFLVADDDAKKRSLALVLDKLDEFGGHAAGIYIISGGALDRFGIMARHYGLINKLSTSASKLLNDEDRNRISHALGTLATDYEILGGHEYLMQFPEESSIDLDTLWFSSRSAKIRSGFYVKPITKNGRDIVLVNAFHPRQLDHFTEGSHRIILFLVHSNTSWATLRNVMIGSTFPDKADPHSIRGTMYSHPKAFGFDSVSIANNGVHLSAGPFEAMFELSNFYGEIANFDPVQQAPIALRQMLDAGISQADALRTLQNPEIVSHNTPVDLFSATEDMDTDVAIQVWKQALTTVANA
jgi:hypothetical protein